MNRRDFLLASATVPALSSSQPIFAAAIAQAKPGGFSGPVCLFSKHVPWMTGRDLGRAVKQLGFEGLDLTVRPGGHVLPEKAAEALPPLVEAIRAEGLQIPMITTALLSAADPTAKPILSTAGKLGIRYAKPGYYRYGFKDVKADLESAAAQLRGLVDLARECKVQIGYHNHAQYLGGPVWDTAEIIDAWDPEWIGFYFDIRHAVAEGGDTAWRIATLLAIPRLKMIAVKDFYWEKGPKGWATKNCPLGEGMVDWPRFLKMLAAAGYAGPVSLHVEYETGGSSESEKRESMLAAISKDLSFLRDQLKNAYGS